MAFDITSLSPQRLVQYRYEESDEYTQRWRPEAKKAYNAYHEGIKAPLTLKNFPIELRPPTPFNRINAAAIQLLPGSGGLIWNIPRIVRQGSEDLHKGLNDRATYTENVVRSGMPMLFRNAQENVPLEAAKHALITGWAVKWTGYDKSLRLTKPRRKLTPEELEEWDEARRRVIPYRCETRNPLYCWPSPGDDGRTYMLYVTWQTQGYLARRYGWEPPKQTEGWEKVEVEFVEYRDRDHVYRMVKGEDPWPKWSGPNVSTMGTGYTTFGTGIGTSDGDFLHRHYGLLMMGLKTGLFALEALFWKLLTATVAYNAVPKPVVDPRIAGSSWAPGEEIVVEGGLGPGERIQDLMAFYQPPMPPDTVLKVHQLVKGEISEATINELVASGEVASDTAATYLTALQESKAKLNTTRDNMEEAFAEAAKIFIGDLRNVRLFKRDDAFDFIADKKKGQQPLEYQRDKLLVYPNIECTCDPVGPQQRASDLRTGLELEKSSGIPQSKINEDWYHSDDPEDDWVQKQAEITVSSILTNPQTAGPVMAYWQHYATHPNDGRSFEEWDEEQEAKRQQQAAQQAQMQQAALGPAGGAPPAAVPGQGVPPNGIDPMQMQAGLAGPQGYQFNPMQMPGSPEAAALLAAQQEQAMLEASQMPQLPVPGPIPPAGATYG